MPFREENRHLTLSLIAIIVGLFVIAIGVQAYLVVDDNKDRDAADREYADCLTRFAGDLVDTIETRTDATARLERASARLDEAGEQKDAATDEVFRIVLLARRTPPEATEQQFDAALAARVRAQDRYAEVKTAVADVRAEVEDVRAANPYEKPKAVCSR